MAIATSTRLLSVLAFTLVCLIFYLAGPHTSQSPVDSNTSEADARLARWLEAVVPPGNGFRSSRAFDPPLQIQQVQKAKPLVPINPFPLGAPSSTSPHQLPRPTTVDFVHSMFEFQEELVDLHMPTASLMRHKDQMPHRFEDGKPRPTFATFLSSRSPSLQDPYFAATLSLVYRLLWAPETASEHYPVTVFVGPYVPQEQIDMLSGAGAIIRELDLIDWEPNVDGVYERLRDQFTKLKMWGFTEFSRIAFMDSDAFPIKNIDEVFNIAERQKCVAEKLTPADAAFKDEMCDYVFAGVENIGGQGKVHGGFLVLEPNKQMEQRLLRNYIKVDDYDNSNAEQGLLNWQFSLGGPFPPQLLPRKFNAFFPQELDEGNVSVAHDKLWAGNAGIPSWLEGNWDDSWRAMLSFYNGPKFSQARRGDPQIEDSDESDLAEPNGQLEGRSRVDSNRLAKSKAKIVKDTPELEQTSQTRKGRSKKPLSEKQQRLLDRFQKEKYPRFEDLA